MRMETEFTVDEQSQYMIVHVFVGSYMYLATKVFIGNLPAMGRGWVIIK